MTEDEARAALRAFVAVGEVERWIAEQRWEAGHLQKPRFARRKPLISLVRQEVFRGVHPYAASSSAAQHIGHRREYAPVVANLLSQQTIIRQPTEGNLSQMLERSPA